MSLTDPVERMAHARAAMRAKYLDEARDQFARLGITPTDEQIEQAGARLMREAMSNRLAIARQTRWTSQAEDRRHRDLEWGMKQVARYAYLLHTWAPDVPDGEQARVALMVLGDEFRSPDGFNRVRLIKRFDALVAQVKAQAGQRSRELTANVREPYVIDLPDIDADLAGLL